jgi:transcriptional regulator with XRE-family HTH domain
VPILRELRRLRERRAWSQRDLAERSGVAQSTIAELEAGRLARHVTTRRLAAALGVEPAELIETAEEGKVAA